MPTQTTAPTSAPVPTVSVIVPAYNAAPYLGVCLEALLEQPAATRIPIEIIVVDDGSTDATADVVLAVQQQHRNVRLIRQANAGVSAARNAGLAAASGEFIAFADADDHVIPGMLANMVAQARREKLQIVIANADITDRNNRRRSLFPPDVSAETMRGEDWLVRAVTNQYMRHYIWSHLYRTDFLARHQLQFVTGISHQDIVWTNQALLAAERVAYLDEPVYCYHQRPGSLSKPLSSTGLLLEAQHYVSVAECLERVAKSLPHRSQARAVVSKQVVDEGIAALHLARKLVDSDRQRLFCALRERRFVGLLSRNAVSTKQRRRLWRRALRYQFWQLRVLAASMLKGAGVAKMTLASIDAPEWGMSR
jgi:heptose III glucuronosyltransferase